MGAVVLAAALPVVFLHLNYQPSFSAGSATIKLSDLAILAVVVAAVAAAARSGLGRLRAGLPIWIAAALFLGWIVLACFYPLASSRAYPWHTHLVTAGEFGLYALLAPAVPLLVRKRDDALLVAGTLVGWSTIATAVGIAQWLGWHGLAGWGRSRRQPSFLGPHDFASLSGMVLGLGLVALLFRLEGRWVRRGAWLAVASGLIGFVIGGASAGIIGLVPATLVAGVVAWRRERLERRTLATVLAATAVASLGVVVLRAGDFDQFFRFLGFSKAPPTNAHIQTYSQRTLLAYIGYRIWIHHPLVGVGFEGSGDPAAFEPELPAAHARFPHVLPLAFPAPQHPYGVQMLYIQVLADLGVVGGVLLVLLFAAGLWAAGRAALRGPPSRALSGTLGLFWLLLVMGLWTAEGLVAGIPLDAVTWLAFGAAAL